MTKNELIASNSIAETARLDAERQVAELRQALTVATNKAYDAGFEAGRKTGLAHNRPPDTTEGER